MTLESLMPIVGGLLLAAGAGGFLIKKVDWKKFIPAKKATVTTVHGEGNAFMGHIDALLCCIPEGGVEPTQITISRADVVIKLSVEKPTTTGE